MYPLFNYVTYLVNKTSQSRIKGPPWDNSRQYSTLIVYYQNQSQTTETRVRESVILNDSVRYHLLQVTVSTYRGLRKDNNSKRVKHTSEQNVNLSTLTGGRETGYHRSVYGD